MPFIAWTEDMSVGVESLDGDHRLLMNLLNRLDEAVRAGRGAEIIDDVLDAIKDYTEYHFGREEALMAACGYPDTDTHGRTHDVLRTQVRILRDRRQQQPSASHDRALLAFLKTWLTAHIMGRDKLYAPFMASRPEAIEKADRDYARLRAGVAAGPSAPGARGAGARTPGAHGDDGGME